MNIIRNLPLILQGIGVAILFLQDGIKNEDKIYKNFAYCIFVSYVFYLPVIFFVHLYSFLGMLMIPKTLAYMVMAGLTYKYFIKKQ